jgi:hypothetical protein
MDRKSRILKAFVFRWDSLISQANGPLGDLVKIKFTRQGSQVRNPHRLPFKIKDLQSTVSPSFCLKSRSQLIFTNSLPEIAINEAIPFINFE